MTPQEIKTQKLTAIYRALLVLLAQKPMATIGVSELCREADVSRTYFYKEFQTYEEIIEQYQESKIQAYLHGLSEQPLGLQPAIARYFQYVQDTSADQQLLIRSGRTTTLIRTFERAMRRLADQNRLRDSERVRTTPYYIELLAGSVINLSVHWLAKGMPESPQQMGTYVTWYV